MPRLAPALLLALLLPAAAPFSPAPPFKPRGPGEGLKDKPVDRKGALVGGLLGGYTLFELSGGARKLKEMGGGAAKPGGGRNATKGATKGK
ncbi:hypothetical protein TeGR_g11373 [Tetraparma gracilis]|uniref:Uncharacterized protein n=1 Tax=Tetraparma gracilis TaxID=2962635 RepID=A0ABQ6MRH9_9STRA|nr:hypothetical protein TeGR_g11373 [Tetraparma gracilis]